MTFVWETYDGYDGSEILTPTKTSQIDADQALRDTVAFIGYDTIKEYVDRIGHEDFHNKLRDKLCR